MIGGAGLDIVNAIVADAKGNAYVAGFTGSAAFPDNPPGAVTHNAGNLDIFVAKLNPTGTKVDWLTFLGGTGDDAPTALARDASSGELYVAGLTNSVDFPTTAGVIQPAANGPEQGFIASISSNGMSFGFVTYLGGGKQDVAGALALTSSGLVVGGSSASTGFPVLNAIQPAFAGFSTSLYASADSGTTWTAADTGLPAVVLGLAPEPSSPGGMLAVSGFDPGMGGSYAADSFAWFRTSNGGASWTRTGLASGFLWYYPDGAQLVPAPSNPAVIYTAYPFSSAMDNGASLTHGTSFVAFRSSDDGATWQYLATPPAASSDGLAGIAVSPTNADEVVEISQQGAVFQSTDGGASFTQISTIPGGGASWSYPQTVAGSPDGSIYVGGCSLYKSTDFGSTWTTLPVGGCVGDVAVSPSNPSVVYAANAWGSTMNVYQSTNAGATWTQVTSPGIGDAEAAALAVGPSNPNIISVASGNQIAVSTNGGTTWTSPATLPSNIWAVGISSSNPAVVYAGTIATSGGFAAKLSTDGKTLLWSTFYAGDGGASVSAVAASGSTSAWIAGGSSPGLPITRNAYSSDAYGGTAFLARIADSTSACSYTVSPTAVTAYGAQIVYTTVTAPSGCAWTATPSAAWITIQSGSSGAGSGIVSASLAANRTKSPRSGSISVAGRTFTITEAPASCTYSLSGNTNVPSAGGSVQIAVVAPVHCPWKAVSVSPSISVTAGSSGSGNGTVTLSVAANHSVVWLSPVVQIGPTTVTLQEADICSYSLSPQSLSSVAASGTMNVTANLAGCSWSPSSDSSWLTVSGSGTGSGTFPYTVTQNTTGASRTANITLDHQVFQVTQQP
jgi:photosystem II stability/assembly factor-like uncharacterized protein